MASKSIRVNRVALAALIFSSLTVGSCLTLGSALAPQANASPGKPKTIPDELCTQPGRVESARELIAEGKDFRLNASQSTVNMRDAIRNARGLTGGANKLTKMTAAHVDQYKSDLNAFRDHVNLYRAHLDQVERDIGHCKEAEKQYKEHAKKYTMHVDQYHLPPIPPPHLCPNMMISQAENAKLAHQMQADQERLARAELDLSNAEGRLANAKRENANADGELLKRSKVVEAERNLAGEFESLKTELSLLNTQHKALLAGGKLAAPTLGVSKVSGTVKGKAK
ncbi:hypothetical protein KA344_13390 [bacterium]|jgi:DNA repair exonuclease SbcCD ATPase subunit|nr:hypothetical protein [bacterium]